MARDRENISFGNPDCFAAGHPEQPQKDFLDDVRNIRGISDPLTQKLAQPATLPARQLREQRLRILGLQAPSPSTAPVHPVRVNFAPVDTLRDTLFCRMRPGLSIFRVEPL